MSNDKKTYEYSVIITQKLEELFEEGDLRIDYDELMEGGNLTHFFHALANLVPTNFFNKITADNKNNLEFNHIANQLVFQYSKLLSDEKS